MPKDEEITWWNREYSLQGCEDGGRIDITRADGYIKMHSKTAEGEVITLARALKNEQRFREWVLTTMSSLSQSGRPLASIRLSKIILQADLQAMDSWSVKSTYLHNYFFSEYLGVGMPRVTAVNSALRAVALGSQMGSGGKVHRSLTVPAAPLSEAPGSMAPGSMDLYSSLPGSASSSGNSETSTALTALKDMFEEALAPIRKLGEQSSVGSDKGKSGGIRDSKGACIFCGRTWCSTLKGKEMCREARRALELLKDPPKKSVAFNKDPEEEGKDA